MTEIILAENAQPVDGTGHFQLRWYRSEANIVTSNGSTVAVADTFRRVRLLLCTRNTTYD